MKVYEFKAKVYGKESKQEALSQLDILRKEIEGYCTLEKSK